MQSRREFLVHVASACVTAGAVIACGSSGDPGPDPDPDPDPDTDMDTDTDTGGEMDPENPMSPDAGQPPPEGSACLDNGTRTQIGTNHGHRLMVPAEDVRAGVARTYDITGTSDHPHSLTVTAAHFEMLAQSMPVTITSTSDAGHTHVVQISCA